MISKGISLFYVDYFVKGILSETNTLLIDAQLDAHDSISNQIHRRPQRNRHRCINIKPHPSNIIRYAYNHSPKIIIQNFPCFKPLIHIINLS
jgi:hypothetical protein